MELARQLTWSTERVRLYHYRTKDKLEVDAVIETPDGRVIGVKVKARESFVAASQQVCGPSSLVASLAGLRPGRSAISGRG